MLHLTVSIFNTSNGEVITDPVSVAEDSNIAGLKRALNYKNLADIQIFIQAKLLDDEDKIQECLEDGDELNAVVTNQEENSVMVNTTNYSAKKIIIKTERNKFINLNSGQRKALIVESSFLWGTFAVIREQDVLEDNESVYQGFKYNLPEDAGIREIQITEKHVLKIMSDDSPVVLPPLGKPIVMKEEEFSKGMKKTFLVDNEGPEIYLLTGTKTSFNHYRLAPNSANNSLKILESKRFNGVSARQFHFGLCKKPVLTERGTEYTAFMYDAMQVLNSKILIRNSGEGEGPNVDLIGEDGREDRQNSQDLPQKIFNTYDRKRFDDWMKIGADVVGKLVKAATGLAGIGAP